jgi:hypothetical protein
MSIPRYGVHQVLEAEANRLIKESMAGVTSQSAKSDILTPWKEKDRKDREVYTESGVPDASVRKGMYHRAYNSTSKHLNSRDGVSQGSRTPSTLRTFVQVHGSGVFNDGAELHGSGVFNDGAE